MASSATNSANAPFQYSTLDAIDDKFESQCIVVRLLSTWKARNFKQNNVLFIVDCLLVDERV